MIFKYIATLQGGAEPCDWETTANIEGEEMTISEALRGVVYNLPPDGEVIKIEKED